MASVVGFDIGNSNSKIGVARARGIDIVTNEVSNRSTPSLVSFGTKARAIGESAATMQTSNYKNTIGQLKRLIGRRFDDEMVQTYEKPFINAELVDAGGEVGVKVRLAGEEQVFSATQLMGMYLGKLRDTTKNEVGGSGVCDVVISVPLWYSDSQRRAMLNAAEIADLNPLRLVNETTATALSYGITKTDLPEPENPRYVMFVDVGHSTYQVAVVGFAKGELTVLGTAADPNFGGRNFDRALVEHFAAEFKEKYKIDVLSNAKATFRLLAGCERLKKVLSANTLAPLNVESLMEDIDASSQLKREEFEALIAPYLNRVHEPLERALAQAGISKDDLFSVEVVGGSSRVPSIKERIGEWFGRGLSYTANQDESTVRGCTLACAMLSPVFRVRDFAMNDTMPYSIKVSWQPAPDVPDEDTELEVFQPNNPIPSTKILTFYRKEPFTLEAFYTHPELLPVGTDPWVGRVTINNVTPNAQGDHSIVKVKTRMNLHNVLSFEGAYTVEEIEKDEEIPVDPAAEVPEGEKPKTEIRRVKKLQRKDDLPIETAYSSVNDKRVAEMKEFEGKLHAADKLVIDTEERKNALEEYIYDMRSKLDERFAAFVQPQEKEKLLGLLSEAEDWLYSEEGEDASKSAYVSRLETIVTPGNVIANRWKQHEERPRAAAELREVLNKYMNIFENEADKYDHLSDDDKTKVIEKTANVAKWLDDMLYKQSELPKNVDPKLKTEDILKNKEDVIYVVTPILSKPKPRTAPEPPKEESTEQPEKQQGDMDVD
ncbi:adenyl-nucleotide exchange factor sse1 [Malassezia cuniculi]|uniref:Adenyl-nucleotide exchange factor sse1 n=1 Tax=Malassezia cuniculi TaxID=948313 RepID=A0AAF0J9S8_9BASI|nr:adenyl-nucleotide exchange factor sse1 [Malassezia cuniculi]